jgi:hypothetical protein
MKIDDWMRRVNIGLVRWSPPAISSLPSCDDIMILNAENFATCENFCAVRLPQ